jgi:leucyl-tRNA synthetase
MSVPGHDERDFEFAKKFGLPIVRVVAPSSRAETVSPRAETVSSRAERGILPADPDLPYIDNDQGVLVHSGKFDGLPVPEAKRAITAWLAERGAGKAVVNYRLHDWCISRQRYWGPPIPIIYCDEHGAVPVPEKDLPVLLPIIEDFRPDDSGVSPLARHRE